MTSNAFTTNFFGFPVFFSNGEKIGITAEITNLYNNSDMSDINGYYKIILNVPKDGDGVNNPPYTAAVFTIFPWYIGGIEAKGNTKNDYYVNAYGNEYSGFGIMYFPIFAHIF